jgi:hypothetical protein
VELDSFNNPFLSTSMEIEKKKFITCFFSTLKIPLFPRGEIGELHLIVSFFNIGAIALQGIRSEEGGTSAFLSTPVFFPQTRGRSHNPFSLQKFWVISENRTP